MAVWLGIRLFDCSMNDDNLSKNQRLADRLSFNVLGGHAHV